MSVQTNRRKLLSGLCAAGLGGLAGCLSSVPGFDSTDVEDGSDVGGTDRTLRLGIMQPLSGDLETVGKPMRNAAELPIRQVEDDIPLDIEYEVADTETSPSAGVQGAADLVAQDYPMVNGPAASDVTLQATQQVLIPYRTVCCSPGATSPTITSLNDAGLVFRTAVSDSLQAVVLADRAANDLGHDSAATLYANNDYGWQLSQAFARSFRTDHGGTVSSQVPLEEGQGSYRAAIRRVREDDPELLVVIGYPETGGQVLSDLGADAEEDILVTDGLQDGDLHDEVDYSLDGIRGTAPLVDGPGTQTFTELFKDEYDAEPGVFTPHSYDASAVLLLANAYAGQNDGTAIRNAMQAVTTGDGEEITPETLAEGIDLAAHGDPVTYQGASSSVGFDGNGDMVDTIFEYWEFDERAAGGTAELERVTS
ncbi:ABC transporter substrate-binding protein [Natrinema salifodinae]|uniref:Amino acid/amide ABC transporter substrate-binding protein, HAAT family n=1 Tax=Natrinema salifodinae TaxID=1202768 RepID=A0A1I0PRN5_9EURY|nr:ABC transporter substrate-binding protein [Natrinema salifodinae]SEW16518.1 amino acid/amide ABC transporter substrate-binding protein, HAAT family [Natrinema salifodinae]